MDTRQSVCNFIVERDAQLDMSFPPARFFPHEIADLSIVLNFFHDANSPAHEPSRWPLRYVTLLWLSLICMLPFDLVQFDEPESLGKTASDIESVAKAYLDKAGIEREGAAILLSRLYAR